LIEQAKTAVEAGLITVELEPTIRFLARRAGVEFEAGDLGLIWARIVTLAPATQPKDAVNGVGQLSRLGVADLDLVA
jgi:hypothetical protein